MHKPRLKTVLPPVGTKTHLDHRRRKILTLFIFLKYQFQHNSSTLGKTTSYFYIKGLQNRLHKKKIKLSDRNYCIYLRLK